MITLQEIRDEIRAQTGATPSLEEVGYRLEYSAGHGTGLQVQLRTTSTTGQVVINLLEWNDVDGYKAEYVATIMRDGFQLEWIVAFVVAMLQTMDVLQTMERRGWK